MFLTAFPILSLAADDTITEGTKAVVRWTANGTHTGNFRSIPPTGKQVAFAGIAIFRFAGAKIAEMWGVSNALGLMQQIGAIPSSGWAGD